MTRPYALAAAVVFFIMFVAGLFLWFRPGREAAPHLPAPIAENAEDDDIRKAKHEWQKILQPMMPVPATAVDFGKVKIIKQSLIIDGLKVNYGFALNILPLLEADKNINARHVQAAVRRTSDGTIETSIWSYKEEWSKKANKRLVIDWQKDNVRAIATYKALGLELCEKPMNEGERRISIIFGVSSLDEKTPVIGIGVPKDGQTEDVYFRIPYDHRKLFVDTAPYASVRYPIAAMPKMYIQPNALATIMLFDLVNGRLLCEINPPIEFQNTRPVFALDMENDALVGASYELAWVFTVDLRPYVQKIKNSTK